MPRQNRRHRLFGRRRGRGTVSSAHGSRSEKQVAVVGHSHRDVSEPIRWPQAVRDVGVPGGAEPVGEGRQPDGFEAARAELLLSYAVDEHNGGHDASSG